MTLQAISIAPSNGKNPEYVMVLLHGWGANDRDLAPLAPMFNLPNYQFFFPNAPFAHPQVPSGRAWYSLETANYDGIEESRQLLFEWLSYLPQKTGVPLEKTILAGFSQGGAMSLEMGLKLPFAGVVAMSGYLQSEPEKQNHFLPPILICHGTLDPVVPINSAQKARQKLESIGIKVQYQEFEMAHEIISEEITLIVDFIENTLSN